MKFQFQHKAKIGYHCWYCGEDTEDYVSLGMDEICKKCESIQQLIRLEIKNKENKKIRKEIKKCNNSTEAAIWRQALNGAQ